jgi:hypothetical protein
LEHGAVMLASLFAMPVAQRATQQPTQGANQMETSQSVFRRSPTPSVGRHLCTAVVWPTEMKLTRDRWYSMREAMLKQSGVLSAESSVAHSGLFIVRFDNSGTSATKIVRKLIGEGFGVVLIGC